uniref:Large ribosomal subunit protein uL22c n=1 Tax=Hypertelis spergulacea TaxID=764270 RepID=A0A411L8S8_9CARY|nr:ribosomal protein L22 [Hypertelis spergulacea]
MLNNLKTRERDRYEAYTLSQLLFRGKVYAHHEYLSLSPDKARRVIDQIRGRSYEEALLILNHMPYRACDPIFKLLSSAAGNARKKGWNQANLIISKAEVNKGPTRKKIKPRARGRNYLIRKTTSHITLVLKDISDMDDLIKSMQNFSLQDRRFILSNLTKYRYRVICEKKEV